MTLPSLIVASVLGLASPPGTLELRWNAPPECPDGQQVLSEVVHLLGGSVPKSAPLPKVDATATRDGSQRWVLDIRFESGGSLTERSVEAESCSQIGEIAALVIALAIDPHAVEQQRTQGAFSPSRVPFALVPAIVTRFHAGLLPQPSVGAGLGLAVIRGAYRFEIEMVVGVPQTLALANDRAADFEVPIEGAVGACVAAWRFGRAQAEVCAGVALAALRGTGRQITHPMTSSALWVGLGAGPALELWIGKRLALRGSLELGYSPSEAAFFIEDMGEVYRTSVLWGGGGFNVEMKF